MLKRTPPPFPMPLITERLIIRPPEACDATPLNHAIHESFAELHRFMDWAKKPPTLKETKNYINASIKNWCAKKNKTPYLPLFLFDKDTHEFIGVAGFHCYDWKKSEIHTGYWIRTSKTGKGLMREAISAHITYAIQTLHIKKIIICCDPDNTRSRNIPEKLGFTLETILLNDRKKPDSGKPGNTLVFAKYA